MYEIKITAPVEMLQKLNFSLSYGRCAKLDYVTI